MLDKLKNLFKKKSRVINVQTPLPEDSEKIMDEIGKAHAKAAAYQRALNIEQVMKVKLEEEKIKKQKEMEDKKRNRKMYEMALKDKRNFHSVERTRYTNINIDQPYPEILLRDEKNGGFTPPYIDDRYMHFFCGFRVIQKLNGIFFQPRVCEKRNGIGKKGILNISLRNMEDLYEDPETIILQIKSGQIKSNISISPMDGTLLLIKKDIDFSEEEQEGESEQTSEETPIETTEQKTEEKHPQEESQTEKLEEKKNSNISENIASIIDNNTRLGLLMDKTMRLKEQLGIERLRRFDAISDAAMYKAERNYLLGAVAAMKKETAGITKDSAMATATLAGREIKNKELQTANIILGDAFRRLKDNYGEILSKPDQEILTDMLEERIMRISPMLKSGNNISENRIKEIVQDTIKDFIRQK